jgi:hypothetical protein
MSDRLYVILDANLSPGLKMAQGIHAAKLFERGYPELEQQWYEESNNIVVLEHEDLDDIARELEQLGYKLSRFHEPDLDDQLTAICVEPKAWRLLSSIKLAS